MPLSPYHLRITFKSNSHPWTGTHEGRGLETDAEAIEWAQYFAREMDRYQITLFKDGKVLSYDDSSPDHA